MKLFSGSSNPQLAEQIAQELQQPLGAVKLLRFSDGEIGVALEEPILRRDVFVIQSCSVPTNDHLMELLIMIDAFRRGGARSITAVVPWLAYSRKEKKDNPQDPISGKLVANLLETAGIDRLIALDLHADAVEGFFDVPVINLSAVSLFAEALQGIDHENTVVVAPDMGGAKRARRLAKELEVPVVILEKIRPHNSPHTEVVSMIGDVSDKRAIIVDDIISTGSTLINAANILKDRGANRVDVCITHPILAEDASAMIKQSRIDRFITTDSIPIPEVKRFDQLQIVSVASLISREISKLIA
ncbi:MAG TPA: ribose-phosphate diphosphokinase [bacterium]|nr:ribose-phosphate diphosphokinase [bacterium]